MQTAPSKTHPSGDKRFLMLDKTMKRNKYRQDSLIEVLHKAQELFGYLAEDVLLYLAHNLKLPASKVYGVATFYHLFQLKPSGKHTCVVCTGTACYVKGANELLNELAQETSLSQGQTSPNGQVSLVTARCIGACGIAPATVYDGQVRGNQAPEEVLAQVKEWLSE